MLDEHQAAAVAHGEGLAVVLAGPGSGKTVFEREDGVWEVIDDKSGRSDPDPLQLAINSRAIEEIWGRRTAPAWFLLRTGDEQAAPVDEDLNHVLSQLRHRTKGAAMKSVIMNRA